MGSLVQLGDVPAWVGASTGVLNLYLGLRERRQVQARAWAETLKELSGMTGQELRHVVEDNPAVAEMIDLAWAKAAETATEDKRRLLAKVVAAALRGDADAELDALQFFLRTVMALDPAHVTLLVIIATPRAAQGTGPEDVVDISVEREEMSQRWGGTSGLRDPAGSTLLDPALATLEGAGLISAQRSATGRIEKCVPGNYGVRFFQFLQQSGEADLDAADAS